MTSCPTDDTLGAHVGHRLDARDADQIASHLDTCAACREIAIAAVRGGVMTTLTLALVTRGALHGALHHTAAAAADLEHAIAIFPKLQTESGHLAAAQLALAELLWDTDRARASAALDEASSKFTTASDDWATSREEARTWRGRHR